MKRLVFAVVLLASPLAAWAQCSHGEQQAMSCAEGLSWDPKTGTCIPTVTG